ncbi:MAG: imidazole glycerol phosphate synthase subunit HisH [Nevskia sp.]|nr:imidazole glycerol phosphate synthase subunit HisH [Nevskia sp.]
METIGVIDYGMGNLHSLAKSLERVAGTQRIVISYDPEALLECDRLVLPGVGGVRACMDELHRLELDQMVIEAARRRPLLGVCLGMQVLLERSDENGGVNALGLIPGTVVRFPDPAPEPEHAGPPAERLKVPHMGWNQVRQARSHPVWEGVPEDSWFYFVHSYHAAPQNPAHNLGVADYGQTFTAAVARDNIVGFQFHPEKSQDVGLRLLSNFVNWSP